MSYEDAYARFDAKVYRGPDCWAWLGAATPKGYGQFKLEGKMQIAHRVSFRFANGRKPSGMLLHICDNPGCVRPSHLREGTALENARDRDSRNRRVPARGARNGKHKLTETLVLELRRRAAAGTPCTAMALELGVYASTVQSAVAGKRTWRHV